LQKKRIRNPANQEVQEREKSRGQVRTSHSFTEIKHRDSPIHHVWEKGAKEGEFKLNKVRAPSQKTERAGLGMRIPGTSSWKRGEGLEGASTAKRRKIKIMSVGWSNQGPLGVCGRGGWKKENSKALLSDACAHATWFETQVEEAAGQWTGLSRKEKKEKSKERYTMELLTPPRKLEKEERRTKEIKGGLECRPEQ